jgi:hypothetical protein
MGESDDALGGEATPGAPAPDLRERVRAVAQPLIDSIEGRVRRQIDSRVDENLDERIDRAVAARLAVLERAVADLDRAVRELQSRGLEL